MTTTLDPDRFISAQDAEGTYERALGELRAGRKRSHWMWFVFPQLAGLGRSATARHFAIPDVDSARDYLAHPVLGPRLHDSAVAAVLSPAPTAVDLLGEIDAIKLRSSATLFARAAEGPHGDADFVSLLRRFYDGEPDPETVRLLG